MMGTLKNLLRMSPERDKTLVKSNKFYMIANEGDKQTSAGAGGDPMKPVAEENSSDSDSFKSILSFNSEMNYKKTEIKWNKTGLNLLKLETPEQSNDGNETFFSYENETEDVIDNHKHFIEEVINSNRHSIETRQPSKQSSEIGREAYNVKSKPAGDNSEKANQFKNELRKFVMLSKKLKNQDKTTKKCKEKLVRSLVYKASIENINMLDLNMNLMDSKMNQMDLNQRNEIDETENMTSTEIIFKKSGSLNSRSQWSRWSYSDTRVLKLYNNTQPIVTTSSDTTQVNDDGYKWESCSPTASKKTITHAFVETQNQLNKPKCKKKTLQRYDEKCKHNFVRANKDLTKFVMKGRQKIKATRDKSCRKKKMKYIKKKTGRRLTKNRGDGERKPCKNRMTNTKPADVIITDILYLV